MDKTTFLRCLRGFLRWTKGETFIDDRPLSSIKQPQLWKRIAYVPQAKGVNFPYTVLEMVLMGRSAHVGVFSVPSERDLKIAKKALDEIGISSLGGPKHIFGATGEIITEDNLRDYFGVDALIVKGKKGNQEMNTIIPFENALKDIPGGGFAERIVQSHGGSFDERLHYL